MPSTCILLIVPYFVLCLLLLLFSFFVKVSIEIVTFSIKEKGRTCRTNKSCRATNEVQTTEVMLKVHQTYLIFTTPFLSVRKNMPVKLKAPVKATNIKLVSSFTRMLELQCSMVDRVYDRCYNCRLI